MPIALLAALAASVITHSIALFAPDMDWLPGTNEEETPVVLHAELHMPAQKTLPNKASPAKLPSRAKSQPTLPSSPSPNPPADPVATEGAGALTTSQQAKPVPPPPANSASGSVSYTVFRGTNGFIVGKSQHQWTFTDGRYQLTAMTETSGLAGLFYPVKIEMQSQGEFGPDGLKPSVFRTLKDGQPTNENADFDWAKQQVRLSRDGRDRPLSTGSQDLLSFHFQLAYHAPQLAAGQTTFPMSVASGKRYDPYTFTVQGEETIETPVGSFRTLHLRASAPSMGADATDVWLAAEHQWLAIKIRFTDRNGDLFEQVINTLQTAPQKTSPTAP